MPSLPIRKRSQSFERMTTAYVPPRAPVPFYRVSCMQPMRKRQVDVHDLQFHAESPDEHEQHSVSFAQILLLRLGFDPSSLGGDHPRYPEDHIPDHLVSTFRMSECRLLAD